jgi:hypothetical protein
MSLQQVRCSECGSRGAEAIGVDAMLCEDCNTVDLGTCVKCEDLDAKTSRVEDGEIRPVCYLCKSV